MPTYRIACLLLSAAFALAGPSLPEPKLKPVPSALSHKRLIQEGVEAHDRQNYKEAIAKYQEVLKENPDDVVALHELAFSYSTSKDYEACVATALRGAAYQSDLLGRFYTVMANCLDEQGKKAEAIAIYQAAMKKSPGDHMIPFNLAITYIKAGQRDEGMEYLQRALRLNPNHPSSHLFLANLYRETNRRIPALMAYCRFLMLEPASNRTATARERLEGLIGAGVERKDEKNVSVTLFMPDKKDAKEADFSSTDMMLSILVAGSVIKEGEKQSPPEQLKTLLSLAFGDIAKNAKGKGFAKSHYAPYFEELEKKGYTEALVYYGWQRAQWPGASEWLSANRGKVAEFLQWSAGYKWTK